MLKGWNRGVYLNSCAIPARTSPFILDLSGALITDQDCPNIMSKEDNPNALMNQYQTKEGDKNGH